MKDYKRDRDHSWDEIDAAIQDLIHSTGISTSKRDWEPFWNYLPEQLVLREIEFLTARFNEMDTKARGILVWFMMGKLNNGLGRPRVSSVTHQLYIGSILAPLLSKTNSNSSGLMEKLVGDAIWTLPSCRPRSLPSDFITERDLPWMRGEMLELVLEFMLSHGNPDLRRSGNNEYCAWAGSHVDEIANVLPHLIERGSIDPGLIRDLVHGAGSPLTEGVL